MHTSTFPFRRNRKGNYVGTLWGSGQTKCTVFEGKYGGWSFFFGDNFGGEWYDTAEEAMEAAIDYDQERAAKREQQREQRRERTRHRRWIDFFGLKWPTSREALNAAYRRVSLSAHPDRGGSHDAMKLVNRMYEEATRWV